jgi:glycosyltransferase involved in cell wall biosynthesis
VRPRVLYCQYTNPAAYPPLEHGARILADRGWEVLVLGTGGFEVDALRFAAHSGITVQQLSYCPGGWRQKLHYARFAVWVMAWTVRWRPRWLYASDPPACPIAWGLSWLPGLRVLYHEHDSPAGAPKADVGLFGRVMLRARTALARRAALCVLPNETRARRFREETGTPRDVLSVWNCPGRDEVGGPRAPHAGELAVLYHGSITPARLPLAVVDALALVSGRVRLRIVGYETIGHRGYIEAIRRRAASLGIADRIDVVGAVAERGELLAWCRRSDVGLALMPRSTRDSNEQAMAGASNKPFDYLAGGLALVVADLPDWRSLFVEPGFARACDPDDPRSLAAALAWYLERPQEMRSMGERGRQRVLAEWNYDETFRRVLWRLEGAGSAAAVSLEAAGERGTSE